MPFRAFAWLVAGSLVAACQPAAIAPPIGTSAPPPQPPPVAPIPDASTPDADAPDAAPDAAPDLGPGEHWTAELKSVDTCDDYRSGAAPRDYHDPHTTKRKFSYDGYALAQIEISREIDGLKRKYCVDVLWPKGEKNNDGKKTAVAKRIKPSWFRLIERTLVRIPWKHMQAIDRFVIDNRPMLHGVAPFHRGAPDEDARDGRTIWLNEHLFTGVNHWVHGTYGSYWAYHLPIDAVAVDKLPPDHDLFSPVLLHEIGHIVNYVVVNGSPSDATCPKCSEMCFDLKNCKTLTPAQREALCATAYCTGFGFESGTENWAEMYRWYYQGRYARAALAARFPACFAALEGDGKGQGYNAGRTAPWDEGLGEVIGYHKTRWDSCKGAACKPY
ncbi:MAG: hypothetical protein HY898_29020 [Deltaproteobacteria bacterium]|nr:hypothetical protein [Deltaproteobacteria bacterium]